MASYLQNAFVIDILMSLCVTLPSKGGDCENEPESITKNARQAITPNIFKLCFELSLKDCYEISK